MVAAGEAVGADGGGGAAAAAVEAALRAGAAGRGEQAGRRRARGRGRGTQKDVQSNGKKPFSEAGRLGTNIGTIIKVDLDLQTLGETL